MAVLFPLGFLGVAGAALGFTEGADGGVAMNLLVTGQAILRMQQEKETDSESRHFTGPDSKPMQEKCTPKSFF